MSMNTNAVVNLINILSQLPSQTHQQLINLISQTQYQPQLDPPSVNRNDFYTLLPIVNTNNTNNNTNNSNKPINSNVNPQHTLPKMPQLPLNNTNTTFNIPHFSHCVSVHECASIRRIVKLGVFYNKYGLNIASLINNCAEYNNLNQDYQHSVIYHSGIHDKQTIIAMSKQYENIYDFINNFDNESASTLQAINQKMETLYNIKKEENSQNICKVINPSNKNNKLQISISNMNIIPTYNQISMSSFPLPFPVITNIDNKIKQCKNESVINAMEIPPEITGIVPKEEKVFAHNNNNNNNKANVKVTTLTNKRYPDDRKYKCDLCSKQYKHLCNLKSHKKIHTDQALICPHCQKRFGRKANYNEHLRIHTGETPYQCNFCKRKFKHHHSWKDHMRIHTGITPYQCKICDKKFKVGHNLTVHLRIHTGEKPYQCRICMKSFRQKSAINSHLKRMHK